MTEPDTDDDTPLWPTTDWVAEHAHRYIATDGADGHIWNGVPTLILTTRGRRSGRLRRMPLIYGRDGDRYVVVASRGGAAHHPRWYLNLVSEPEVTVQVGPDVMRARARTAEAGERDRLWSMMSDIWPDYEDYRRRAAPRREIPVVVLEPTGEAEGA